MLKIIGIIMFSLGLLIMLSISRYDTGQAIEGKSFLSVLFMIIGFILLIM